MDRAALRATCTLLYIGVSLLTRPLPVAHLERFHALFRDAYGRPALFTVNRGPGDAT